MNEFDRFVDDLIRQRRPRPFRVEEHDVPALAAAIELSNGRPGTDLPSAEFLSRLHARLAVEFDPEASGSTVASTGADPGTRRAPTGGRQFLRRAGVVAACAASAAAGSIATGRLEGRPGPLGPPTDAGQLQPNAGSWQLVTTAANLPDGAVHAFEVAGLRGFVHRQGGRLIALSGVCTHQGCLLTPDVDTRGLNCPCHRTSFDLDGHVVRSQLANKPRALPRIPVRELDGQVQVLAPSGDFPARQSHWAGRPADGQPEAGTVPG